MGNCGKKDPELLEIPGTEGLSVDFFKELMEKELAGQDIPLQQISQNIPLQQTALQQISQNIPLQQISQNIPLQQIAGLTGAEKTTQNMLKKYLGTSATQGEAYQLGMGEIKKTLGGEFYDPRTSDFWKGYRDVSAMEQEKGVADIRRRGQLGGGLYATPGQRTEADYIKGMGGQRTMMLGGLYEKERDRKTSAVGQALGYAGFEEAGKTSRLQLGSTIGAIPRGIEDRRLGAKYTQQMGQMGALNLQNQAQYNQQMGQMGALNQQNAANFAQAQGRNQAQYAQQMGQMGALNLQNQAQYNQQMGQMGALNQQNAAEFAQTLGQEQSDWATQLAQIGIQTGAAQELMPQWNVDEGGGTGALGGILGIIGSLIGK